MHVLTNVFTDIHVIKNLFQTTNLSILLFYIYIYIHTRHVSKYNSSDCVDGRQIIGSGTETSKQHDPLWDDGENSILRPWSDARLNWRVWMGGGTKVNVVGREREHTFHNINVSVPAPPKGCFLLNNGVSTTAIVEMDEMGSATNLYGAAVGFAWTGPSAGTRTWNKKIVQGN